MENELRFAVLIDADNVSDKYIKIILEETANNGIATYKRIYGDWTSQRMNHWKNVLLDNSILPMQQYSYTTGKNSTDSAMIIDAMDILYSGTVDGFCIVSSDSDFTRLVARLRESGMQVIGMGESKTPQPFISACNQFKYLDLLLEQKRAEEAEAERQAREENRRRNAVISREQREGERKKQRDLSKVRSTIEAILETYSDEDGWVFSGKLGDQMTRRLPDFDVRNFGFNRFTSFVKSLGSYEWRETQDEKNQRRIDFRMRIREADRTESREEPVRNTDEKVLPAEPAVPETPVVRQGGERLIGLVTKLSVTRDVPETELSWKAGKMADTAEKPGKPADTAAAEKPEITADTAAAEKPGKTAVTAAAEEPGKTADTAAAEKSEQTAYTASAGQPEKTADTVTADQPEQTADTAAAEDAADAAPAKETVAEKTAETAVGETAAPAEAPARPKRTRRGRPRKKAAENTAAASADLPASSSGIPVSASAEVPVSPADMPAAADLPAVSADKPEDHPETPAGNETAAPEETPVRPKRARRGRPRKKTDESTPAVSEDVLAASVNVPAGEAEAVPDQSAPVPAESAVIDAAGDAADAEKPAEKAPRRRTAQKKTAGRSSTRGRKKKTAQEPGTEEKA